MTAVGKLVWMMIRAAAMLYSSSGDSLQIRSKKFVGQLVLNLEKDQPFLHFFERTEQKRVLSSNALSRLNDLC
jgi:hypothetical protein